MNKRHNNLSRDPPKERMLYEKMNRRWGRRGLLRWN